MSLSVWLTLPFYDLLVMVESILHEGTVALGTSMDFWKSLRRSKPRGRGSGGREDPEEAVETGGWIQNVMEKN